MIYLDSALLTPLLMSLSLNSSPVHSYNYTFTENYGKQVTLPGTSFYSRTIPTIQTALYFGNIPNWSIILDINTGTYTEKFIRYPKVDVSLDYTAYERKNFNISVGGSFILGGETKHTPCRDSQGTLFHCYYGVTPESPLFFYDYLDVEHYLKSLENNKNWNIDVSFNWSF